MNKKCVFRLPDNTTKDNAIKVFGLQKILNNDRTAIFENSEMRFCFDKSVVRVMIFDGENKNLLKQIKNYFYGEKYERL